MKRKKAVPAPKHPRVAALRALLANKKDLAARNVLLPESMRPKWATDQENVADVFHSTLTAAESISPGSMLAPDQLPFI